MLCGSEVERWFWGLFLGRDYLRELQDKIFALRRV